MKWYYYALAAVIGFIAVYIYLRKKKDPNFRISIDTIESEIGIDTATDLALRVH